MTISIFLPPPIFLNFTSSIITFLLSPFIFTYFSYIFFFYGKSQETGQTLIDQNIGYGWSKNSSPFSRTPRVITDPGSAPFAPSFESIPSSYLTQYLSSRYYSSIFSHILLFYKFTPMDTSSLTLRLSPLLMDVGYRK